ncbi:MAG: CRTAC1 family protein [Litoreibacter sp.]|nr:CRTAC1 family protein [Litoreibacter sp.]MCY4336390.1 CRTAC1 family protein [Litoreibacter sp.]
MRIFLVFLLGILPVVAQAEPRFEPRPLPVEHIYQGGWEHFVGGGVAVLDCNGDGFDDVFVAGGVGLARLLVNQTTGAGADIAFSVGAFEVITGVTGAYPLDIDSDGHLDLAVLRVGANVLLKGGPDCTFADASDLWGFDGDDRWSTAFSATWEAGRDWPTLAFGNYVDRSDPDGPFEACDVNEVHRHDGKTYVAQDLAPGYCALSMLFSDWNRDGTQDLRVSNDRHYYVRGGSEQMWSMPDLVLETGAGWEPISIWGMGIASQDLTGDGRPEVVLTSMGDQLMQIASANGYEAAPFEIGTYAQRPHTGGDGRPSTGWHAEFGDVDNDGHVDLFIAKGNVDQMPGMAMQDPNNLLMQRPDGSFVERGLEAGVATMARSRGAALHDLNRDGLLDLLVVNRRAGLELYQNATRDVGHWLAVDLSQTGSNPDAIGAWVEVKLEGRVLTQELTVGGGHVSGALGALHFGLGTAEEVELRVIWPGGEPEPWRTYGANQIIGVSRF